MFFIFQYILGVIIAFFEIQRKKEAAVDLLTIFNIVYLLCFVIAPITAYYMLEDIKQTFSFDTYNVLYFVTGGSYDFYSLNFYVTGILALLMYLILIGTFKLFRYKNKITFLENVFAKSPEPSKVYKLALFTLFISLGAFLYSIMDKGFTGWFFSNARMHFRGSDEVEMLTNDSWLIGKLLTFSQIAAVLFWGLSRKGYLKQANIKKHRRFLYKGLFYLSFVLALVLLYRSSGRLTFFRFIAVFMTGSLYLNRKNILKKGILIGAVGVFLVLYGRAFFRLFLYKEHAVSVITDQGKEFKESYYSFISNFTFPFFSVSNNLNYLGQKYNYFLDFFKAPFALIPERILDIDLNLTSEINTERTMGQADSTVPPDIISYGLINGGVLGVLIVIVSFAIILKVINDYAGRLDSPVAVGVFVYLAFNLGFRVMYFDPVHFLSGSLSFLITLILFSLLHYRLKVN